MEAENGDFSTEDFSLMADDWQLETASSQSVLPRGPNIEFSVELLHPNALEH